MIPMTPLPESPESRAMWEHISAVCLEIQRKLVYAPEVKVTMHGEVTSTIRRSTVPECGGYVIEPPMPDCSEKYYPTRAIKPFED